MGEEVERECRLVRKDTSFLGGSRGMRARRGDETGDGGAEIGGELACAGTDEG